MKYVLKYFTAIALTSTTAMSVVACGKEETNAVPSWGLDEYESKQGLQLWFDTNEWDNVKDFTQATEVIKFAFWTGIFDADDADGSHDRQLKRYNDQKVSKHLDINTIDVIKIFLMISRNIENGEESFNITDTELVLDQDVRSKTDQKNPKDYVLKASSAKIKNIKVNLIGSKEDDK